MSRCCASPLAPLSKVELDFGVVRIAWTFNFGFGEREGTSFLQRQFRVMALRLKFQVLLNNDLLPSDILDLLAKIIIQTTRARSAFPPFGNHVFQYRMHSQRAWLVLFDWIHNRPMLFLLEACCARCRNSKVRKLHARRSRTQPRRNHDETMTKPLVFYRRNDETTTFKK